MPRLHLRCPATWVGRGIICVGDTTQGSLPDKSGNHADLSPVEWGLLRGKAILSPVRAGPGLTETWITFVMVFSE
jgi:hypothetical protein